MPGKRLGAVYHAFAIFMAGLWTFVDWRLKLVLSENFDELRQATTIKLLGNVLVKVVRERCHLLINIFWLFFVVAKN